jgi:uncharacterized protein with LGFP repeats
MDQRMTRATRSSNVHVTWSDFRTAVRYDPASRLLLAVPAISTKRAEHPWLGEAVTLHTRVGRAETYRREYERGAVYWSERTGAHEVHGEIAARWRALGGESSFLGLPTTDGLRLGDAPDEHDAADGYAHFEGGSIYRTARHGTAVVHGMIRDIWALLGWERSALGVPVADVEYDPATGVFSGCFEHGRITWSPAGGPDISITACEASDHVPDLIERDALGRLHTDFAPLA